MPALQPQHPDSKPGAASPWQQGCAQVSFLFLGLLIFTYKMEEVVPPAAYLGYMVK